MKNLCKPLILFLALIFLISYSTLALAVPCVELAGPGDLDNDGNIDGDDYAIFRSILGTNFGDAGFNLTADYDGDGSISYADLSFSTSAPDVPSVELVGPISDIFVGDTFDVIVVANDVEYIDSTLGCMDRLLSFGFDLNYNMTSFAFNGATIGSLFFDDSSLLLATDVAGSAFPGVSGDDILLASLSFASLTVGTFSLGITSSSSDLNEGLTTLLGPKIDMTQNLDIEVSGAPIPEPSTMILMCLGLVCMIGGCRNKFKK